MVVQCGQGSDAVQGLSVRAIATVSPKLLGWFAGIRDNAAGARLIEVWLDSAYVQSGPLRLTIHVQECQRRTSGQVRTIRHKKGILQFP